MTLMDGFKSHLTSEKNQALLSERKQLSIDEYEKMFNEKLPTDGGTYSFSDSTDFAINKISGDIRYYNK
jgi:hydroxymethylglutaryl-CoA synthase